MYISSYILSVYYILYIIYIPSVYCTLHVIYNIPSCFPSVSDAQTKNNERHAPCGRHAGHTDSDHTTASSSSSSAMSWLKRSHR